MNTLLAAERDLTPEQICIADDAISHRQLVIAGPGTGKTHTLIARLVFLLGHGDAAGRVLVLSFSRAAVKEIRDRCRLAGGNLAYVHASTFDAFATQLLSERSTDVDWTSLGYDDRIRAACDLLTNLGENGLSDYRHVLIDELQDLVGCRAELVKLILMTPGIGFTAFGDPAQGIYNFQLEGEERRVGSNALYAWFRSSFGEELKERHLTDNHRAQSLEAGAALVLGDRLRATSNSTDDEEIYDEVVEVLQDLTSEGKYEDLPSRIGGNHDLTTAVLCSTNGQALMISRRFLEAHVSHSLQRSATDRFLPDWIAKCLTGFRQTRISKSAFLDKAASVGVGDAEDRWQILHRVVGIRGQILDLSVLNHRFRVGAIPDDLIPMDAEPVRISTIHRAKGLEFDNVVLAYPKQGRGFEDAYSVAEEARTLFVGMTRAKRLLRRSELPRLAGLYLDTRMHRWIRKFGWKVVDVEIGTGDVDRNSVPQGVTTGSPGTDEIQGYLGENVSAGDPLRLEVCEPQMGPGTLFHILHGEMVIGRTSTQLCEDLCRILNWRAGKRLPRKIDLLMTRGIETVFGDPALTADTSLGSAGCWLAVRAGGLGRLVF